MTLEDAYENWHNQDFEDETAPLPNSVKNAATDDLGLTHETFGSMMGELPNAIYVLTIPSGETAFSTKELQNLCKALVDKKMAVYHCIQSNIGTRKTNEEG